MNKRRDFIKQIVAGTAALSLPTALLSFAKENGLPIRAITKGPKYRWFGYYDKLQFDPSNRYILGMEVDFEYRSPTSEDVIKLGYIDLKDHDKWVEIGETRAWGWQQGCMLQWVPGTSSKVIWNDRRENVFVSIIKDIETGEEKIIPKAIYTISPDGKYAVGTDFPRIQFYRPGYGYAGVKDPYIDQNAPATAGIFKINLKTGKSKLIINYQDIAIIPFNGKDISNKWHYFNHLLISPDGERFIFLNRWRETRDQPGWTTRMFTVNKNGKDLYLLDSSGKTSHFIWKDSEHITMWTEPIGEKYGFWEFRDKSDQIRQIGKGIMEQNGHNTFLPGTNNDWILNDTYPQQGTREQIPYLFQESTKKKIELGRFYEPEKYRGEWRCDTHPRSSNDGKLICIDSTHEGNGRQMYLIDISSLNIQ